MTVAGPATTSTDLRWVWLASEVLLVATSIASVLMLSRIFADDSFVSPLMFTVIVSHGVLIAMRWFGFPTVVAALVSLLATAGAIVAIHYSATAIAAVIPTGTTITQIQNDMTQAGEAFRSLQAPVPPITGFVVIASAALWLITFTADWASFRLFAPGQALIPYIGLLVFVSMLGTQDRRVVSTATAVVCAVLFLLAHRAASRAAQGIWLDQGPGRGYLSLMAAGGIVAIIAATIGIIGGPSVPGANEAPLVEIGDEGRTENKPLEVISPLVQIQPRLIEQSDRILFTVESDQRAYWRIAALDVFDGVLWRSQGQFRSAGDDLGIGYPSSAPVLVANQTYDLGQLNVVWAPAAYLPTSFENLSDSGVNYESESATFIVDTNDQRVSDGLRYRVVSQMPMFTPELLTQLAASSDQTVDSRYLELPADYSPLARATALEVTAGLTDPYAQALALQNYFRQNFTYDIDVAKGHDIRRMEDFLTVQRGYCEQFAGTYASMARAIGLPARVATGFTPGEVNPSNPNLYTVRGRHAHAWPEVFIAGAGWVAFEPTPGRGAPNATSYTGVPEAQDSVQPEPLPSDQAQAAPEPVPAPADPVQAEPTPTPVPPTAEEIEAAAALEEELAADQSDSDALETLLIALLVCGAIAGWAYGIPALKRRRERRRSALIGDDPRRRVTLAWATTVDTLETSGQPPLGAETLLEYAARIIRSLPITHPQFDELTTLAVEASYRDTPPSIEKAERAEELAAELRRMIDGLRSWSARSAAGLDPRPLLRFRDPVAELANLLADGATSSDKPKAPSHPLQDPLFNADPADLENRPMSGVGADI